MTPGTALLRALRREDLAEWRRRITLAMSLADGYVRDHGGEQGAASILSTNHTTLWRWLAEDKELRKLPRARRGVPSGVCNNPTGRPLKKKTQRRIKRLAARS